MVTVAEMDTNHYITHETLSVNKQQIKKGLDCVKKGL